MNNTKISNSLLSWILEYDCEFIEVINSDKTNTYIVFKPHRNPTSTGVHKITDGINIHQFIHLAKIKAFEYGYEIMQNAKDTDIVYKKHKKDKMHSLQTIKKYKTKKEVFKIENVIEALEWVVRNESTKKCLNCENMVERLYCNHYNNYILQLTNDEIKNCGCEY